MKPSKRQRQAMNDTFAHQAWRVTHEMKHKGASYQEVWKELFERRVAFFNHFAGILSDGWLVRLCARMDVNRALKGTWPCERENCNPLTPPWERD